MQDMQFEELQEPAIIQKNRTFPLTKNNAQVQMCMKNTYIGEELEQH